MVAAPETRKAAQDLSGAASHALFALASARPYVPASGLENCGSEAGWLGLAMVVPRTHEYADTQLGICESRLQIVVAITNPAWHAAIASASTFRLHVDGAAARASERRSRQA